MTREKSIIPPGELLGSFLKGINSWRVVVGTLITLIGGMGTIAGFHFVTEDEVDAKVSEISTSITLSENIKHTKIDNILNIHENQIGAIGAKIQSVQTVQHMDIAVREARRVTAHIKNQHIRSNEQERVRRENMRRLANLPKSLPPCSTVNCTN